MKIVEMLSPRGGTDKNGKPFDLRNGDCVKLPDAEADRLIAAGEAQTPAYEVADALTVEEIAVSPLGDRPGRILTRGGGSVDPKDLEKRVESPKARGRRKATKKATKKASK